MDPIGERPEVEGSMREGGAARADAFVRAMVAGRRPDGDAQALRARIAAMATMSRRLPELPPGGDAPTPTAARKAFFKEGGKEGDYVGYGGVVDQRLQVDDVGAVIELRGDGSFEKEVEGILERPPEVVTRLELPPVL